MVSIEESVGVAATNCLQLLVLILVSEHYLGCFVEIIVELVTKTGK